VILELGGGTNPHPRADIVIDFHHPFHASAQDATSTPWTGDAGPIADDSADEVYASHFLEHIPKGQPIIDVMNEAWRILRPGGTFTIIVPLVGYTSAGHGALVAGWWAYADPTHVQGWWLPESLLYFCEGPFKPHADYGMRTWSPLGDEITDSAATALLDAARNASATATSWWAVRSGWEGIARLVKPRQVP
jgi:SAM-dependent methyltransferase